MSINQSAILNSKGRARKHCVRAERTASPWWGICIEYFKLDSLGDKICPVALESAALSELEDKYSGGKRSKKKKTDFDSV